MQDFSLARRTMVDSQLRPQAVTDRAVLAAMGSVPREDHVPAAARAFAYFDRSIAIDGGRRLMPPAAIGRLLSAVAPRAGERALIVAPAGGYSRALLEQIGLMVDTVEGPSMADLDGPYDVVLIDGAVDRFPAAVTALMGPQARIGGALREAGVSRLVIGQAGQGHVGLRTLVDADVAPIAAFDRPASFTF